MIELQDLCVGYQGQSLLQGVSLSFSPGSVMALLGPNGCGKSTLLRTVLGLQPKIDGRILVDGTPAERLSPKQLALKAAYLPQSRNVPNITARRMVLHGRFPHLSYPRRYRPEDYSAVNEALRWADAEDVADSMMSELSGGQQQKVYLAMALAQNTETIFMDEPTTYLDISHQLEVMRVAQGLARQGKAVVMVLHDLRLAMQTVDEAAVLFDGRIQLFGTPDEIFSAGIMDRIFGIAIRRVWTESGWRYYYA